MNKAKIFALSALTLFTFSFASFVAPVTAAAQETSLLCQAFPFLEDLGFIGVGDALCTPTEGEGENVLGSVGGIIRFGLSLIFIGIIGIAIFYIIKSSIKYIRSEGDEGKVQESQKAIKAVFMGVAALMVGIIGLVVILALFNSTTALNTEEQDELPDTLDPLLED